VTKVFLKKVFFFNKINIIFCSFEERCSVNEQERGRGSFFTKVVLKNFFCWKIDIMMCGLERDGGRERGRVGERAGEKCTLSQKMPFT